jgi:hypothetical protein
MIWAVELVGKVGKLGKSRGLRLSQAKRPGSLADLCQQIFHKSTNWFSVSVRQLVTTWGHQALRGTKSVAPITHEEPERLPRLVSPHFYLDGCESNGILCGCQIAKHTLDVWLEPASEHLHVVNGDGGITGLGQRFAVVAPTLIEMVRPAGWKRDWLPF